MSQTMTVNINKIVQFLTVLNLVESWKGVVVLMLVVGRGLYACATWPLAVTLAKGSQALCVHGDSLTK